MSHVGVMEEEGGGDGDGGGDGGAAIHCTELRSVS